MLRTLLAILTLLALLCGTAGAAEPIRVMTSILPLETFAERIGGDRIQASAMVRPGASPATYEPRPRQMAELAGAQLYLAIGVPFEEAWLPRFRSANPDLRIIRTDRGIEKIPMASEPLLDGRADSQPATREAAARGERLDPHIWLSPERAGQVARSITRALQQVDPKHEAFYAQRLEGFLEEIRAVDRDLAKRLEEHAGKPFLVYHPSWGYLARDYGLRQVAIEQQGKAPTPARLREIIRWARDRDIETILVQPQFSTKQARTLAEAIGARLVPADPLARRWAENLRRVARTIAAELEGMPHDRTSHSR